MLKTKLIIFNLLLLLSFSQLGLFSQDVESQLIKMADEAYRQGDYLTASTYYGRLVNDVSNSKLEHIEKYARALYKYHAYADAAQWYEVLYQADTLKKFPETMFWLATATKQNAKYQEAHALFLQFLLENNGNNNFLSEKATIELKACKESILWKENPVPIKIEHLTQNINTPYSEFNAIQLGDTALYFSSLRLVFPENLNSIFPAIYISKIYRSAISVAGYSEGKELPLTINNPETHNANFCFSPDKNRLYFSRCKNENNFQLNCEIWVSEQQNGKWKKPERLNRRINAPGVTSTQPFITSFNEKEILYFVSDRAGGYGGMDIWYSIYEAGKYQDPSNLGSVINTKGNEITPFYDDQNGDLFFSSDWHPGMGGYDVFKSQGALNQWEKPKNIGYPFNSPTNDIYFSINQEDTMAGYFTSNRKGSLYINGETCCNDIYYYEWLEKPKEIALTDTLFVEHVDLSLKIKELLPLTLYFHNDEPDPATTKTTTTKNYKTTLADYFGLMDIYKDEYAKGLSGDDRIKAQQNIEVFFNDYVKKGYTNLTLFAEWLKKDLDKGNHVKITIKGYTSPLHTADYNLKLASRRISSLKNYIYEFNNGVFIPYINGEIKNCRLELLDAPIGKTEASPLVSDNPNDKRNSIYSRAAALERRIQIVMYESDKIESAADTMPELFLAQKEINFGEVKENHEYVLVVQYINTGQKPLIIENIDVQNSAVEVNYRKIEILPNEKSDFVIRLKTNYLNSDQTIKLKIKSNAYNSTEDFVIKAKKVE
ncbi:MAG: DUF1573 domain-containing protein [Bacteroidales bacterium]|nr:DUF1573 domain-containing protein [Bacteroidales bacterium]